MLIEFDSVGFSSNEILTGGDSRAMSISPTGASVIIALKRKMD